MRFSKLSGLPTQIGLSVVELVKTPNLGLMLEQVRDAPKPRSLPQKVYQFLVTLNLDPKHQNIG